MKIIAFVIISSIVGQMHNLNKKNNDMFDCDSNNKLLEHLYLKAPITKLTIK